MKNLFNFFFSFDKLLKEKLIIPFFWLAIIVWGLDFFADFLAGIRLGPLAFFVNMIEKAIAILLALVVFRLMAELATAIFRINDNLSPDGGKSELADIDLMAETKKAAEAAANRAKEFTHTATEKTKSSFEGVKDSMEDVSDTVQSKAKSVSEGTKAKTEAMAKKASKTVKTAAPKKRGRPAGSTTKKPIAKKTTPKTKAAPKKRGRPAGSKTTTKAKTTTAKKRGPKPGYKAPRDKDGNLLKKDGTPRAKPGPKPK